jgi:hypothetical protein
MGPADQSDDLVVSYIDGTNRVLVFRGSSSHPTTTGVHARSFTIGQDVRIDHASGDIQTEYGSSAGSIADQNGDGARDLVIGSYRENADTGMVLIVDGNTLGTAGITTDVTPGVLITRIAATVSDLYFGAGIVNNATEPGADVDGDGLEDLLITTRQGASADVLVWFGGSIPPGDVTTATAQHVISGPSTFNGAAPGFGGTLHAILWAGDVNGDGLADVCWGDFTGNGGDGSFQVFWDDGT